MAYPYEKLSTPYKIGKTTIKNRFCMAPMGQSSPYGLNGEYTQEGIHYFEERAQGGFGLILTGALVTDMKVDPFSALAASSPMYSPYIFMRSALDMTDRCHKYGSKVFAQITMGLGRNYPGLKAPSAVEIFGDPNTKAIELTTEEVQQKIQAVIQAAGLMKASGFDGVEVHAIHWGYLLDAFAMSITNHRTDQYGGSLENRLRPCKEIIEGIRVVCGKDFPVSIRVGIKSYIKGLNKASFTGEEEAGRTVGEGVEICKLLESYGYDCLNIDAGVYDSFYYACPPMYIEKGFTLALAKAVKKAVNIPVLVGGSRLDEPEYAMEAVREDTGDAVVLGRAALADPFLPKKFEMGTIEEIKPCIGCNSCVLTALSGANIQCAVNPTLTREELVKLTPVVESKKVVIVGGGLAGMEAARVLKLKGHQVSVYEKTNRLGGNLNAAQAHDFKHDVARLNTWYQRQMKQLDIPIRLNTELNVQNILDKKPDVVVFSTGSVPVTIHFDGCDRSSVISCLDAIEHEEKIGGKAVIVGGGQIGCEIAIDQAKKGKQVTIVEALDDILSSGAAVPIMNKMALVDILDHYRVTVLKSAHLDSVDETGANVTLTKEAKQVHLDADTVILSVGFKAGPSIASGLVGTGIEYYEVGDGVKAGDVRSTIHSAFEIARRI